MQNTEPFVNTVNTYSACRRRHARALRLDVGRGVVFIFCRRYLVVGAEVELGFTEIGLVLDLRDIEEELVDMWNASRRSARPVRPRLPLVAARDASVDPPRSLPLPPNTCAYASAKGRSANAGLRMRSSTSSE